MLKCITKCPKGYDRCCHTCELKEFCNDACKTKPEECSFIEDGRELRYKARTREMAKRFWRLYIIGLIAFLALLFTLLVVIGNQNAETIRDRDMLDKLNEISVAVDPEESEPVPADPAATYQLTPEERDLVERVVASESRGEDLQGQMAVAQVIKDRSDLWDMHPVDVVFAEGQFAKPYEGEISDEVKLAVANVFDGGVRVFQEPTTHFAKGTPYWAEGKINRGNVGRHTFWY
jgi:hypothetical protein